MRKYRYRPVLRVTCTHPRHQREWKVRGTWEEHCRTYLRSPAEAYGGLHKAMRQLGIDWFQAHQSQRPPHTAERRRNISKAMKASRVWNRGTKQKQIYPRPNTAQWLIVTIAGQQTITNLDGFCRQHGLSRHAIRSRIKRNSWPYLNILRITKWK